MRPRIWRPFSSTNRARMEPPSLTREPRGPFCMAAVEDILRSILHQPVAPGQVTKVKPSALAARLPLPRRGKPRLY